MKVQHLDEYVSKKVFDCLKIDNSELLKSILPTPGKVIYMQIDDGLIDIFEACINNNSMKCIKKLISDGVDPNSNDKNRLGCLEHAILKNEIEIISALLEYDNVIVNEDTLRHVINKTNSTNILDLLIKSKRIDVNKNLIDNCSVLAYALLNGDVRIVKMLLSNKCDVYWKSNRGKNLLQYAIESNVYDKFMIIFELMSDNKKELNNITEDFSYPVRSALKTYNTSIIKTLLSNPNVDVNLYIDGKHILHDIIDDYKMLQLFVTYADINRLDFNSKDRNGWTPLEYACKNGYINAVRYFFSLNDVCSTISCKLQVNDVSAAISAHILAYSSVSNNEVSEADLKKYFLILLRVNDGETLHCLMKKYKRASDEIFTDEYTGSFLEAAVNLGADSILRYMLSSKKCDFVLREGRTLLHNAILKDDAQIVFLLLKCLSKEYKNKKDDNGKAPLHLAVTGNKTAIINNMLNDPDVDINVKDNDNQTPLHLSISCNSKMIFLLLAKNPGIEINVVDKMGRTPIHLAIEKKLYDYVHSLLYNPRNNIDPDCIRDAILKTDDSHLIHCFQVYCKKHEAKLSSNTDNSV